MGYLFCYCVHKIKILLMRFFANAIFSRSQKQHKARTLCSCHRESSNTFQKKRKKKPKKVIEFFQIKILLGNSYASFPKMLKFVKNSNFLPSIAKYCYSSFLAWTLWQYWLWGIWLSLDFITLSATVQYRGQPLQRAWRQERADGRSS